MKRKAKAAGRPALIDRLESRSYLSGISFSTPAFTGGLDSPTGIAVGSLRGNGKQDLVVAGDAPGTSAATVAVYLNQGSGTFGTPTLLPFFGTPGGVAIGNFRGGGHEDIAAIDSSDNTLTVFLNDGSANFTPGVGAGLGGSGSGDKGLVVADFNGDHNDDVAVVDSGANQVNLFYSRGDTLASFVAGPSISVPSPVKTVVGDFNGDSHPDLATLSSTGAVYISLNDGTGNFAAPVSYAIGTNVQTGLDVAAADFTGDSRPDLVVLGTQSISNASVASVLINQGDGTFSDATVNTVSTGSTLIATGNFSNSSGTDIAAINGTGELDVLAHGGAVGTFQAADAVFSNQLGTPGSQAVAADFNGDGRTDIAFLSTSPNTFGVVLNTTGGVIPPPITGGSSPLTASLSGVLPTTPVVAGSKIKPIHQKVILTDTGSALSGQVTVNLLLSTTTTGSTSDPTVATFIRKLTFKSHQSRSILMTVKTLPGSASGTYHLVAEVIDPSMNTNVGPSATTLSVVPATIDLSGTVAAPAAAKIGHKATIALSVTNAGSVPATGPLEIKIYASTNGVVDSNAVLIADLTHHISIKPGKPLKLRIAKLLGTTAGSYYLIVQLDPSNAFHDSNVANNAFVSPTQVALA